VFPGDGFVLVDRITPVVLDERCRTAIGGS
jgi:hypothetical protein